MRLIDRFGRRVRRTLSSLSPSARLPHEVWIYVRKVRNKIRACPRS